MIDLTYAGLIKLVGKYAIPGRTESKAFLMWFLENYYHLDEDAVEDATCDGKYDMGIDGIYVDHTLQEIDIFQCKLSQNDLRTLGDTALKEFVGSLAQFENGERVIELLAATTNTDLKAIIEAERVAELLKQNYTVRGVFISNTIRDVNAMNYLKGHQEITLYDRPELEKQYVSLSQTGPIEDRAVF